MLQSRKRAGALLAPWNSAAAFIAAAAVGGVLIVAWPVSGSSIGTGATGAALVQSVRQLHYDQCSSGDAVSAFKCRNTWYANLKSSYR